MPQNINSPRAEDEKKQLLFPPPPTPRETFHEHIFFFFLTYADSELQVSYKTNGCENEVAHLDLVFLTDSQ